MSLLTVIIPIYNSERNLSRSIESLLHQTVSEFNIILVDDGSTDNSGDMCDEYVAKYPNITVIHKGNGGISSSRNAGIKAAKTGYIAFLDADDYFSETFVEDVLEIIRKHNPDCIYFGWQYVTKEGKQPARIADLSKNTILDKDYIHKVIIPPILNLVDDKKHFIDDFSVNKIYKKSILSNHCILFDETRRIWEDRTFVVEYLRYCETFYCMDNAYYNYVQVEGSLSSKYYLNFFDIVLDNYQKYYKWFSDEYEFDNQYSNDYWCRSIENMIIRSLEQKENLKTIRNTILEVFKKPIVVKWYKKRKPANRIEKLASELLQKEEYEKLLQLYEKQRKQNNREKFLHTTKFKVRTTIRKIIKWQ